MSGSYRTQTKQTRGSRQHFSSNQPPTNYSRSSHGKSQGYREFTKLLSNVSEGSHLSSEVSGESKERFAEFIQNLNMPDPFEQPASPIFKSYRSNVRRLEDQQIIVVEQENEIGSNCGNKQSIILQHIDFNSEQKQHEETPEWEVRQSKYKHEGVNYVINCVVQNDFLVQEEGEPCSQTVNDFSATSIKTPKVRYSKKTCIERLNSIDSSHIRNFKAGNRSCIAQASNRGNSRESLQQQKSNNQQDLNQILNKWNAYSYPESSNQLPQKDTRLHVEKRKTTYDMQKEAKQCVSSYQSPSRLEGLDDFSSITNQTNNKKAQKYHIQHIQHKQHKQQKQHKQHKQQKQVQTQLTGAQIKQNLDKINNLQKKLKIYKEQNTLRAAKEQKLEKELVSLRKKLTVRQDQLQHLRETLQQSSQQKNKGQTDDSKSIENRNKELETIINNQNQTMKMFEEKQNILQKKLQETLNYLQKSTKAQPLQSKKGKVQRFDSFGSQKEPKRTQGSSHLACNSKIQFLQEYIFDMEQERVGIELQVSKRLKVATSKLQSQLRMSIKDQFKVVFAKLKEENSKLKEVSLIMNSQRLEMIQKWQKRQKEFLQREEKVRKMYNQIVVQCYQNEKANDRPLQKRNTYPNLNNPNPLSLRNLSTYQPASNKLISQDSCKNDSALKNNFSSNKQFFGQTQGSTLNGTANSEQDFSKYLNEFETFRGRKKSTSTRDEEAGTSMLREDTIKENKQNCEFLENNELLQINSKIQRLRSEINRELQLIN